MSTHPLYIRSLGLQDYNTTWQAMRRFTAERTQDTVSEIWLLQHPPVYTLGQAGKPEHILSHGEIPIVQSDRGGQVTYHAPGQLVIYLLLDLKRAGIGVRRLVDCMENAVIELLKKHKITAFSRTDAPGVYVDDAKIAALGLRVRHGYTYHGLALNMDMDLTPYEQINPCGYTGLPITQTRSLGLTITIQQAAHELVSLLALELNHLPIWISND